MNKTFTTLLSLSISLISFSQTQITNGGFENWDNVGTATEEPVDFNSNKTGSTTAQLGGNGSQTCFRDASIKHGGSYSLRLENKSVNIIITTIIVNGSASTGVVNAPSTNKADGYLGTTNYGNASDVRRLAFTGRPDSIVGWYQYTSGGTGEVGKITAILHNNHYYDPETPSTNHPDPTADKIARATFLTPTGSNATWTRFSAPFVYTASGNPSYIMINMTPSNNQLTTFAGSKIWFDDISFIYNSVTSVKDLDSEKTSKVYVYDEKLYVDFGTKAAEQSTIELFDVTGRIILSQKLDNTSTHTIDISNLNTGIYIYKVSGNKSDEKIGKIFID
ncbi:MAG TPA: T9SS type A sorting domain-containing protein [Bacteroidia bacterium]|nr:T9SS type A sorting domain-containing protein [Bacteroidia bacterium]